MSVRLMAASVRVFLVCGLTTAALWLGDIAAHLN